MRKVLFLMFLLLLMVLGAAGVKAQVRIGGNTPPNPAAVLDLNTTDDATPAITKGALALPRVNLTSNTMQLISGVPNLTGTLVYNTNATLVAGVYSWDGSAWKRVDAVPATTVADSGFILMSTPTGPVWTGEFLSDVPNSIASVPTSNSGPVTWIKVLDAFFTVTLPARSMTYINTPGVVATDFCYTDILALSNSEPLTVWPYGGTVHVVNMNWHTVLENLVVRCYRPSI